METPTDPALSYRGSRFTKQDHANAFFTHARCKILWTVHRRISSTKRICVMSCVSFADACCLFGDYWVICPRPISLSSILLEFLRVSWPEVYHCGDWRCLVFVFSVSSIFCFSPAVLLDLAPPQPWLDWLDRTTTPSEMNCCFLFFSHPPLFVGRSWLSLATCTSRGTRRMMTTTLALRWTRDWHWKTCTRRTHIACGALFSRGPCPANTARRIALCRLEHWLRCSHIVRARLFCETFSSSALALRWSEGFRLNDRSSTQTRSGCLLKWSFFRTELLVANYGRICLSVW